MKITQIQLQAFFTYLDSIHPNVRKILKLLARGRKFTGQLRGEVGTDRVVHYLQMLRAYGLIERVVVPNRGVGGRFHYWKLTPAGKRIAGAL